MLFCPSCCKDKQSVGGFTLWRTSTGAKKSFNKKLLCPAGHTLLRIINSGRRSCNCCNAVEIMEGTAVYACCRCDWVLCHFCYQQGTPINRSSSSSLSTSTQFLSPGQISRGNIKGKIPPLRKARVSPKKEERGRGLQGCLTNFINNFTMSIPNAKEHYSSSRDIRAIGTPERILNDLDRIRSVVKAVAKMRSRSVSRRDSRSPSYYSPRHRRRYCRSDSSSPRWSDESEISPYRRRRRQKRRRRMVD